MKQFFLKALTAFVAVKTIDDRGFNSALLSLRGIAAVVVAIFHAMLAFRVAGRDSNYMTVSLSFNDPLDYIVNNSIIYAISGHAAVSFFFVHSGFVLTLSQPKSRFGAGFQKTLLAIPTYVIRRVFRLFPMIIVSCTVAYVVQSYANFRHDDPFFTTWFKNFFSVPTNLDNLIDNILLVRNNLVPFLWSLRIEVWSSLTIPLIYFACRRYITIALYIYVTYVILPPIVAQSEFFRLGISPKTNTLFFIGGLIGFVRADLPTLPKWINRDHLTLASVIALVASSWVYSELWSCVVQGLSSAVIINNVYYHSGSWLARLCDLPLAKFIGTISYSLYVNSWVCIFFTCIALAAIVPAGFIASNGLAMNILLTCCVLPIVVCMSWFTYRYVEEPLTNMGRRFGQSIETIDWFSARRRQIDREASSL